MANKDKKRFPSPANIDVDKSGKPKAPEAKKEEQKPLKKVEGKRPDLVKVFHKGKFHIILHNSVHAIVPGENWIDKKIISDAQKHPTIFKHVKDGVLVIGDEASEKAAADAAEAKAVADAAEEKELDVEPESEQE